MTAGDDTAELLTLASAVANVATHLGMAGDTEQKRRDYHVARIEALRDIETRLRLAAAGPRAGDTAGREEPDRRQALVSTILDSFAERSTQMTWLALAELAADAVIRGGLATRAGDIAPDDEPWIKVSPEWVRRLDRIVDENARLRSEAAALRDAGNALAAVADVITERSDDPRWEQLSEALAAWRSAAGTPTTEGGEPS